MTYLVVVLLLTWAGSKGSVSFSKGCSNICFNQVAQTQLSMDQGKAGWGLKMQKKSKENQIYFIMAGLSNAIGAQSHGPSYLLVPFLRCQLGSQSSSGKQLLSSSSWLPLPTSCFNTVRQVSLDNCFIHLIHSNVMALCLTIIVTKTTVTIIERLRHTRHSVRHFTWIM